MTASVTADNREALDMKTRKSNGFTLIEVMITVAIVAILAAIGYPAYQDQLIKSRRADAMIALGHAAQMQERWFTQNGTYTTIGNIGGSTSDDGYYAISVTLPTGGGCSSGANRYCYTLTATPQAPQNADTDCANFTLDNTGAKGISGTSTAANCW